MSGAMEEEKGDGRKKKIGAFWSINFIKHIKRVSSGICQRVVKLQCYVCNMMNNNSRSVNSKNYNGINSINPWDFCGSSPPELAVAR